jgi:sigma-B regulation protein RsbU (phosphoserine phosphatase)
MASTIASILELDELLDAIVHRIAVDFGCIESSILLVDGDEFHLAAVHGCTQSRKGERWPVTEGLSAQVVAIGKAYYAPDVTQELLYRACEPHTRSEVIIPLTVRDRIIGVFGASHHDVDAFPRAQIEILKALAGHIAVAVDNAQRFQDERRQMQRLHDERDEARRIQQNLPVRANGVTRGEMPSPLEIGGPVHHQGDGLRALFACGIEEKALAADAGSVVIVGRA